MNYRVFLEPYRLDEGHVGESVYRPVFVSQHRSPRAAARRLVRLIRGTDREAVEYLDMSRHGRFPIALRYVARETRAPFKALSVKELRDIPR